MGEDMDTQIRADLTEFIVTNYLFGDVSRAPRDEDALVDEGIIDCGRPCRAEQRSAPTRMLSKTRSPERSWNSTATPGAERNG